jgi:low affinity Fe/Cu permease
VEDAFYRFAHLATEAVGSALAFALALLVVVVWATTGPLFSFNTTWQLVINTGTTIVTFLMVFLIQHTQNRDARAAHIKLDALIASNEAVSNRLIALEQASEEEIARAEREGLKRKLG